MHTKCCLLELALMYPRFSITLGAYEQMGQGGGGVGEGGRREGECETSTENIIALMS